MSTASLTDAVKSDPSRRPQWAADGSIASVWKTSLWLRRSILSTELLWADCYLHTFPKRSDCIALLVMIHHIFSVTSMCIILSVFLFIFYRPNLCSISFKFGFQTWPCGLTSEWRRHLFFTFLWLWKGSTDISSLPVISRCSSLPPAVLLIYALGLAFVN